MKPAGDFFSQTQLQTAHICKLFEYQFSSNISSLTGSITFTNGSTDVTGESGVSKFTSEIVSGDLIKLDADGTWSQVLSVTDDENLVLTENYIGTGGTGASTVEFANIYYTDNDINTFAPNKNGANVNYLSTNVKLDQIKNTATIGVDRVKISIDNISRDFSGYLLGGDKRGSKVIIKGVAFVTETADEVLDQWTEEDADQWIDLDEQQWIDEATEGGVITRKYVATIFEGELDAWTIDENKAALSIVSPWIRWRKKTLRLFSPSCAWNFKQQRFMGYWDFNKGSDSTVYDKSGHENNGAMTGVTFDSTNKKSEYSLLFDADSEYVTVSDSVELDGVDAFSASFWIRPTLIDANDRYIISKGSSYDIYINNGKIKFSINGDAALTSVATLSADTWYHIVVVFDKTLAASNRKKIYINGSLDITGSSSETSVGATANDLFFGKNSGGNYYRGYLDEIKFYRSALSALQVEDSYNLLDYHLGTVFCGNCPYVSSETWCDKSYDRCNTLGQTNNFGGFRWLPAIQEKDIWWGGYGPDKGI